MIAIGSDHRGYKLKEEIKKYLEDENIEYKDFGTYSDERMNFPGIGKLVAKSVQDGDAEKGILICGTGFGMAIVANKYRGIRCTPCVTENAARYAKSHNNANILALGAEELSVNAAINIIRTWIATEFSGGIYEERIKIIEEIEKENMK